MKFYNKRGKPNYKEKRYLDAIDQAVKNKMKTDPDFGKNIKTANTFEELKELHDRLTTEDAQYEDVTENETDIEKQHKQFRDGMADTIETKKDGNSGQTFLDPFNDAEPIIRDYVMEDGLKDDDANENKSDPNATFEEPKSFAESFELPTADDERSGGNNEKQKKSEPKKSSPINPQFDEMSGNKKRRSTKKFAKIIVEGVGLLAEKGCIWWTTKDITEDKLVQYELEDKMDLQILLTLDDSQQITVREWFGLKVKEADTLFKISKEDKEDLIDSLFEVMLEKGIAPTPMQELMINAVKTFILDMGVKAYAFNQQIKSVLNQLIAMKEQQRSSVIEDTTDFDVKPEVDSNPVIEEVPVEEIENDMSTELALVKTDDEI